MTIVPQADSLGHAAYIRRRDLHEETRAQLLAQLTVYMGGRAAEELRGSGLIGSGVTSDLQVENHNNFQWL